MFTTKLKPGLANGETYTGTVKPGLANGETFTGTVKAFNTSEGFGFLAVANHPADVCFHKYSDLVPPQLTSSNTEGRQVRATVTLSAGGKARAATLSA